MSEIVKTLLQKYKELLTKDGSIGEEMITALEKELSKEQPNADLLAEIVRKQA